MPSSIRILSSTDVDKILPQLDIDKLINVHTARLFRTLTVANVNANTARSNPDGSIRTDQIIDPDPFVDSPHRLAVQAGSASPTNPGRGGFYTTLVMPSSVADYGTTVKLVSIPNPTRTPPPRGGLPATTVVVDERSGAVKAVVNARALNIRTALGEWSAWSADNTLFAFAFSYFIFLGLFGIG